MSTETYEKINAKDKPIAEDFVYVYSEIEDGGFRKVSKAMLKVLLGVATKLSELENDKEFITKTVSDLENYYSKSETYSKDEIDNRISLIPRFNVQVVSSLPTTNISETTVYLVSSGDDSDNLYTEYINVNGLWEILGTQKIASVENAVLYTEQSLTEEQKTQARTNISAASAEEVGQLREQIGAFSWNRLTDKPFYSEYEEAEIFSERTFTTADLNPDLGGLIIEDFPQLVDGDTYVVNFNGVNYSCVYTGQVEEDGNSSMGFLGNQVLTGGEEDTGEPFVFGVDETGYFMEEPMAILVTMDMVDGSMTEETTWTFSIKGVLETVHKLDNKYVDSEFLFKKTIVEEEILNDERIYIPDTGIYTIDSKERNIESGMLVTVVFNGTEYNGRWKTSDAANGVYIGNMALINDGEDTGEPFLISYIYSTVSFTCNLQLYSSDYLGQYVNVSLKYETIVYNEIPLEYANSLTKQSRKKYKVSLTNKDSLIGCYEKFKSGATITDGNYELLAMSSKNDDYAEAIIGNSQKLFYVNAGYGKKRIPILTTDTDETYLSVPFIISNVNISDKVGYAIRAKKISNYQVTEWELYNPSELSGNVDLTGYVKTEDLETEVSTQLEGAKADIAQQVIDAFNGLPLFGTVDADNNIKISSMLADGEYTLVYENSDGTTTELGTFIVDGESGADSNNLIASSVDSDGQPYNSGLGYKDGYRLNSSGVEASASGKAVTGFIPVTVGKKLYGANLGWDNTEPTSNYFALYDENFTKLQSINETNMRSFGGTFDINNGGFQIYVQDSYGGVSTSNAKYVRISGTGSGANFIISNEAIE